MSANLLDIFMKSLWEEQGLTTHIWHVSPVVEIQEMGGNWWTLLQNSAIYID